jgi:hypothetical protein
MRFREALLTEVKNLLSAHSPILWLHQWKICLTMVLEGRASLSSTRAAALDRYRRWNGAIYTTLFGEPRAQAPAYLYLEPELLARAAVSAEVAQENARSDLIGAVRGALGWDRVDNPFFWHLNEAEAWADEGMRDVPPFLALLTVLVLGAEAMVSDAEHAAHNYYDRLLGLLEADDSLGARIRRGFKDTVELWLLLNDWLAQWDGELGLPSAQITDRRVNIGYPISQALVSGQDRKRLAGAFEDYGLRPGRRMAPLEMEQYLSHWLGHASAPARLRRVWGNEEARRRVVQIACAELEAWAGPAAEENSDRSTAGRVPLLWRADLSGGPLPVIDLYLACQADPARVEGLYQIAASTDATGRAGLTGCEPSLSVRPIPGTEFCGLEPWAELSLGALLAGAFTLTRREMPAVTLARSSNPILVLAHDDRDGLWHEVSRAQLLERCIVLAHADVRTKVEAHLGRYARAGYRQLDHSQLAGLPPGWRAFLDVVLSDAPEDEAAGVLTILSPLRADVISMEGGVRLSRQTWHADAPPVVVATLAAERRLQLAVERRRALDLGGPEQLALVEDIGRASRSLAGIGLLSGDYLVGLSVSSKDGVRLLDQVPLRLRNASFPRPARLRSANAAVHVLEDARGIVSAYHAEDAGPAVTGGLLLDLDGPGHADVALRLPGSIPLAEALAEPLADSANSPRPDDRTFAMPCAVLGHHYWIVDAAEPGEDWRTLKHMRCRECQREEWTRNRGRRPRTTPRGQRMRHGTRAPEPPRARLPALEASAGQRPALDLMLDAMSYMGSGSWAALLEMARALQPDQPWLAGEAARAFSALGHVDIVLNPRTQRPASWHMAPATLVETSDGSWVLAGARSDRLMDAMLGASSVRTAREGDSQGLTVIRAWPADENALLELAAELEASGVLIGLSERFSERLARYLPPLAGLLRSGEPFKLGSADVERLDLPSRQWASAIEERAQGAYRTHLHGRLHGVITGEDAPSIMRVTDMLSSKHLAAAQASAPLVAYDRETQLLTVPMGAELPGLIDRAATLCSGAPAFIRRDTWLVHYPSVPSSVAGQIQRCLGL